MKPKIRRGAIPVLSRCAFTALCCMAVSAFGAGPAIQGGSAAAVQGSATTAVRVTLKDFRFTPDALTVKAGTTVIWINDDDEPHTVVSATGLFRSGAFDTGGTFAHTFDKPGVYKILCSIHPRMMGTIVVE